MTSFKLFGAALILSTAFATPVFAQVELPGLYAIPPDGVRIGSSEPGDAMTVQPARVNVGGLRLPARPHRAHHITAH